MVEFSCRSMFISNMRRLHCTHFAIELCHSLNVSFQLSRFFDEVYHAWVDWIGQAVFFLNLTVFILLYVEYAMRIPPSLAPVHAASHRFSQFRDKPLTWVMVWYKCISRFVALVLFFLVIEFQLIWLLHFRSGMTLSKHILCQQIKPIHCAFFSLSLLHVCVYDKFCVFRDFGFWNLQESHSPLSSFSLFQSLICCCFSCIF